ncbi:uncharacterized protein LOC130817663 [Amaranthus tricolor]|uniref:uncharacterized protein LOC130817663 n=1 Tax=Amaranthus tricolor TaxID=29722 RepID=UPI002582D2B4|nr:uncharacterized protein LOC130817663 [Amaranthus tricolor]
MHNSSNNTPQKLDQSTNGVDDSRMMTIDYLRARLHSERLISKAAKEKSDELEKKVKDLEEQLKVVTLQRKRAEKTALVVLSYLDSIGINDISEAYESDSNEEESEWESNMETNINDELESSKIKGNGKESSGSEHDSTRSSSRSLSWKGRKESTRLLKKSVDSPTQTRTNLALLNSLPRHRLGKSCRQIRRRELRSTIEQSRNDSSNSNAQAVNGLECLNCYLNGLDFSNQESKKSPEKSTERGSRKNDFSHSFQAQTPECSSNNSTHERECNGEMERAIKHQAQLISCHEAQEKAQRDWEEKYGENNDSCEPGSHSDVTEERDETKAAVLQTAEVGSSHGRDHEQKTNVETNSQGKKPLMTQFSSFKISPDADRNVSEKHNFSEMQLSTSTLDFAFSVGTNNQSVLHTPRHSPYCHVDPSHSGSSIYESKPIQNQSGNFALVRHEEHAKLGSVLDALQEAKLMIKQHMNSLPKNGVSIERAIETSIPANTEADWLKLPVRCPGLFRVPTDHEGQVSNQNRFLGPVYPSESFSSTPNAGTAAVQGHPYISGHMGLRLGISRTDPYFTTPVLTPEFDISNRQPGFEFRDNISDIRNANSLPHSSFPDFFPRTSSNQTIYSQFSQHEIGDASHLNTYPSRIMRLD